MMDRYIVFDTETPNSANNRISAIGISVIERGDIIKELYYLVNLETEFDAFNIWLTNITPKAVGDKPTFPEVWKRIEPVMSSGLLIAHNAPFDMSVLAKCLQHYNIDWVPYVYYACTCQIGRVCLPDMPDYKLDTLCTQLNIPLNHHSASSDSHACAELLLYCLNDGAIIDNHIKSYDLKEIHTSRPGSRRPLSEETQKLLELKVLLREISADNQLTEEETFSLKNWMDENTALQGNFPFDKIFATVQKALEDCVLEDSELSSMLQLFEQVTDPVAAACCCEEFNIEGKTFCLSGEFDYGEKSAVEAVLVKTGGIPVSNITRVTDYLIVGGKGSSAWSSGNYGTKVKKALEMQSKGLPIQIIREQNISFVLVSQNLG